jgi:hypothetical protein
MRANEFVTEAFDQPYPIKWEKSEYGDYDALATLDDGSYLHVMFEHTTPYEVNISFYRNNSQEVTGEGDAQRVFATVLTAIQEFLKTEQPANISFSASKEMDPSTYYEPDEPQPNPESRAKLYNRLVQRYARSWGYQVQSFDHGTRIDYELTKLKQDVAETINPDTLNKRFRHKQVIGNYTYTASVEIFLEEPLLNIKAYDGNKEIGHILFQMFDWEDNPADGYMESGGTEVDPKYRNKGVASTMYAYAKMLGNDVRPSNMQSAQGHTMWAAWKHSGGAKHLTGQVEENFADGKVKGKSRPGRVKRAGASCDGSVTDLRARAKNASGEKAKMYHWCANMKSGRKK